MPVPLIARITGLPASVLEQFGSDRCCERAAAQASLQRELAETREALADLIQSLVPAAEPGLRRLLLTVRRDCHNGRNLIRHATAPGWPELRAVASPLVDRALVLEAELSAAAVALLEAFGAERERERRHLRSLLTDRRLVRGIALASPASVDNLHRLDRPTASYGRKEARLENTLLRYVSRAAFKTSPYSTLTPVGFAMLRDDCSGAPRLLGHERKQRSLLRLKRYLLDQCWDLLRRHAPFRSTLTVIPNDTLESAGPGRYRFVRPGFWNFHAASGELRYFFAALVQGGPGGAVPTLLLRAAEGRLDHDDLLAMVRAESGAEEGVVREHLDRLVELGFLLLLPPWPTQDAHLESRMLEHLRAQPSDPGLRAVAAVLERIVDLESSFPESGEPARVVTEIEGLIDQLWAAVTPLAGLSPDLPHSRLRTGNLYEDVLLLPAENESPSGEVVHAPLAAVREVLAHADLLARLLQLFNHRFDFLLTLQDFLRASWPDRREMSVLELLGTVQPLWHDYIRFSMASRKPGQRYSTFNPRDLPALKELRELRAAAQIEFGRCIAPCSDGSRLDPERLASLVATIPVHFEPPLGPCLFLQAADAEGTLWVLNRMYEGTGRYGSRFTPIMGTEMQRGYTDHLSDRAVDDRGRELLDLSCAQGDTLNVHAPQTPRVLAMPGDALDLPPSRRVSLRDLKICWERGRDLPYLADSGGGELLPVHLGGAGHDFMPTAFKILSLFGPGELQLSLPRRSGRREGGTAIEDRVTLGNLVLARRRWHFTPNPLHGALDGLDEPAAFAAIDRWRRGQGLPDRVVYIEKVHHERLEDFYKPQYLDFTSTLFVALFRSSLRENAASLTFEEILPEPADAPCDGAGERRALELLVDSLALRPPGLEAVHQLSIPNPTVAALCLASGETLYPEPAMAH